jgi:uncharacterized protein YukE
MNRIAVDPDAVDKAANQLKKVAKGLSQNAREMRSAAQLIGSNQGRATDRARQEVEQLAKEAERLATVAGQQAKALAAFARQARELNMRHG